MCSVFSTGSCDADAIRSLPYVKRVEAVVPMSIAQARVVPGETVPIGLTRIKVRSMCAAGAVGFSGVSRTSPGCEGVVLAGAW